MKKENVFWFPILAVVVIALGLGLITDISFISDDDFVVMDEVQEETLFESSNKGSLFTGAAVGTQDLGVQAESNCNPPNGTAWNVNSTVVCENRAINVSSLTVADDSSSSVSAFDASTTAAADITSSNSADITNAIPDMVDSESDYTADWDSTANQVFKIIMNESENKIQLFSNMSTLGDKLYFVDIDNDASTGDNATKAGSDFVFSYISVPSPTHYMSVWNVTLGNWQNLMDLSATNTNESSFSATNSMTNASRDFMLYWNYSNVTGAVAEVVIDINGTWQDLKTYSFSGGSTGYTTFKNNTDFAVSALGGLTLTNVTLNNTGDITVGTGTSLDANGGSVIQFKNSEDYDANFTASAGSTIDINGSTLRNNESDTWWAFLLQTGDFNITNNVINDTYMYITNGTSGLVYNNEFNDCDDGITGLDLCMDVSCNPDSDCVGLNLSTNTEGTGDSDRIRIQRGQGIIMENHIVDQPEVRGCVDCQFINNTAGIFILTQEGPGVLANNTFINNQCDDGSEEFRDSNDTTNDFIYYNSYGKINWSSKANMSVTGVGLNYSAAAGTNIVMADNNITLSDDAGLVNYNSTATIEFYSLTWATAELLKDGVRCDDGDDCNVTYNSVTGTLIANVTSFSSYTTNGTAKPNVTLISPDDNQANDSAAIENITFECNVTDDLALVNVSLYITDSSNSSFAFNQSTSVTGTTNSSSWSVLLGVGNYTWNCLGYDSNATYDWGDSNRSLAINYSAPAAAAAAASSTSSSTSSSGGGSSSSQVTGQFAKVVWQSITSGDVAVVNVNNGEIGFTEVSFTPGRDLYGVWLGVERIESLPDNMIAPNKKVYKYVEVTKSIAFREGDIVNPTINFKIKKSWLSDNDFSNGNIALYRYVGDQWTQLDTTLGEDDGEYVHYVANTPGFSYFAIAQKGEETVSVDDGETTVPVDQSEVVETPEELESSEEKGYPLWVWIISAVVLIAIVALIIYRISKK